jgi:hypothetical protein
MDSSRSDMPAAAPTGAGGDGPIPSEHVAAIAAAVVVVLGRGWSVVSVEPAARSTRAHERRPRHAHDPKRPERGWRGRT